MPGVALEILKTGKGNPGQINKKGYTALTFASKHKMDEVLHILTSI